MLFLRTLLPALLLARRSGAYKVFETHKELQQAAGWHLKLRRETDSCAVGELYLKFSEYGPISEWDVSRVKSLSWLFFSPPDCNDPDYEYGDDCYAALDVDISAWDTSKVTLAVGMFQDRAFNNKIGDWDTSKLTRATQMFAGNSAFNQNIGDWDTSSLEAANWMFDGASAFNQDISDWDTSSLITAEEMFYDASAFNQNLGWCFSDDGSSAMESVRYYGYTYGGSEAVLPSFEGAVCELTKCGVSVVESPDSCPTRSKSSLAPAERTEAPTLAPSSAPTPRPTPAPTPRPSLPRAPAKPEEDDGDDAGNSDSRSRSSDSSSRRRTSSLSVIIVVCVAAAVLLVATLFVWNKRAVAHKQPHRDTSMPTVGDVEES